MSTDRIDLPRITLVTPAQPRIVNPITALLRLLSCWHDRWVHRRKLEQLDDDNLRDVGLTRSDIRRESSKPFWRA